VGGVTAGAAGLVGAVRDGAERLEAVVARTASAALSHPPSPAPPGDPEDGFPLVSEPAPTTSEELAEFLPSAAFAWCNMQHKRWTTPHK